MPQQKTPNKKVPSNSTPTRSFRRCKALTTAGTPCKRPAMAGLSVCSSHGGRTTASRRKSKKAETSHTAQLWGLVPAGSSPLSIEEELNRLARNKLTDITAIRIELGKNPQDYYGMLLDSEEETEGVIGEGFTELRKRTHKNSVHPLVSELHKAEAELVSILRLLQEITGGAEEHDTERLKIQTAREVARLMRAYPGISVDAVAKEVAKRG